jgi:hypothetical protein
MINNRMIPVTRWNGFLAGETEIHVLGEYRPQYYFITTNLTFSDLGSSPGRLSGLPPERCNGSMTFQAITFAKQGKLKLDIS